VPLRRIPYARVDAVKSRELLIQYGLVEGGLLHGTTDPDAINEYQEEQDALDTGSRSRIQPGRSAGETKQQGRNNWSSDFPFLRHNQAVLEELQEIQARSRRYDLIPGEEFLFTFYASQIPDDCSDRQRLRRWYQRAAGRDHRLLKLDVGQFVNREARSEHEREFPEEAVFGSMKLPLTYQLDPGTDADGVTVTVPLEGLSQLSNSQLSWLVPGLLEQKILALIRSLPKAQRVHFVPAPDSAAEVFRSITFGQGDLLNAVAAKLSALSGETIDPRLFDVTSLPDHLRFNIRVVGHDGRVLTEGRDPQQLQQQLEKSTTRPDAEARAAEETQWHRRGFRSWDFADIPEFITIRRAGLELKAFPAIVDDQDSVSLTLCDTAELAAKTLRSGLRRLCLLTDQKRLRGVVDTLPSINRIRIHAAALPQAELATQLPLLVTDRAYLAEPKMPRNAAAFELCLKAGRQRLGVVAQEMQQFLPVLFEQFHQTRAMLEAARGPGWDSILADLRQQLAGLFCARFLTETPWPWLIQFPRYLQAMRMRIQRLTSGGIKTEHQLQEQFLPSFRRWSTRSVQNQQAGRTDPMLEHYRWMLEEYRVSLFAQKLGTAVPISARKLDEHWEKVK
ncbi:MAG: DUF3418 domain-containing protein, partial [Planctomycetaceae bacterium]|nr:DUF3418 domain-containing protein [Planctomycetaceae bacterium]